MMLSRNSFSGTICRLGLLMDPKESGPGQGSARVEMKAPSDTYASVGSSCMTNSIVTWAGHHYALATDIYKMSSP